jgi:anti-anti-sigma factor
VQVVRVSGEIDAGTVAALDQALEAATADGARHVVLDLSGVGFLDSSGLRSLVQLSHRLAPHGGVVTCTELSDPARRTLEVSGLLAHFTQPLP